MKPTKNSLIESDAFPFEFLSIIGERESWRKEVHRPVYHVHKWWAKRLGSVFRGILLGCALPSDADLLTEFYRTHSLPQTVFDPFLGSGTTVGEAHKLGMTAIGRDINPVAVESVRVSLGPMDSGKLQAAFSDLADSAGKSIRRLYRSTDLSGRPCDVLYYFWVMQATCPACQHQVDLFSSWVIAGNAYPKRKPEIRILCPSCGDIFTGKHGDTTATCSSCKYKFRLDDAPARGTTARCSSCHHPFHIAKIAALDAVRPTFRLYGKLVLTQDAHKEYVRATAEDIAAYDKCTTRLKRAVASKGLSLPTLRLERGNNTDQAIGYGFLAWRDFFNDRQLLALGLLRSAIEGIPDEGTRDALLLLFSGLLEFNNLFASYKGEGTGAVRHMFAHHILKPERTPIEANVWGTHKSSGSFSNLFRSRLLRAAEYQQAPTEVNGQAGDKGKVCSLPFAGPVEMRLPDDGKPRRRAIYLSCGDSGNTSLPDRSVDLVVTDPPFFDNVHYSELADFFYAWQQLNPGRLTDTTTTRSPKEVQDSDASSFGSKLQSVFSECRRVLKDDGLLVFTYHHSRDDGWKALADAILSAGLVVVKSHPVKSEMSVAAPKSQAKEPIQLDIIIVCRKRAAGKPPTVKKAVESAKTQFQRLRNIGLNLSRNDKKVILFGQLLEALRKPADTTEIAAHVKKELDSWVAQAVLF